MRVTSTSLFTTLESGLNTSLAQVQSVQAQLATGKRINDFSDDPAGAVAALRMRSEESSWTSYQRTADDAKSWLSTADSALQSTSDIVHQIQSLAVSAVNGAASPTSRAAIAAQISQLRSQLVDLGNTQYMGRGIFAGFADTALTADPATGAVSFTGDNGQVLRQIGPDVTVQANVDGKSVFGFDGAPGSDLFSTLDSLVTAVQTGNTAAITTAQTALDGHATRVSQVLGTVGATTNRIDAATNLGTATVSALQQQRSQLEDVDIAKAILQLNMAQTGYQAALGAAAKANLPSLADFLR